MPITIHDPAVIEQLLQAGPTVEFVDAQGRLIAALEQPPSRKRSKEFMDQFPGMTAEQLAASRAKGPRRTMDEIMADIEDRLARRQGDGHV